MDFSNAVPAVAVAAGWWWWRDHMGPPGKSRA